MLGRVWRIVADGVDGLKTLIVAGTFVMLGLAEYTEAVNLQPVFDLVFGADRSAKIMIFMPIVFASLRFVTDGAPRWTKKWNEARCEDGHGRSAVDTPEGEAR